MSHSNAKDLVITRRDFAYRSVLVAATAVSIPIESVASPSAAHAARGIAEELNPLEDQPEINAKVQSILDRYGDRFTDAQKEDIRRLVASRQRSLKALRAFQLSNFDQPGDVLTLYP
jgi:hypothetical protein